MKNAAEAKTQFFVVHAGREIAVGTVDIDNNVKILQKLVINDWISSVRLYDASNQDECRFCALSGHNVAMEFVVTATSRWSIVNKSACVDKCTLYCSYILGTEWENTTCFGGNAFGELIIWTVGVGSARDVLHRLSGHNVNIYLENFYDFRLYCVFHSFLGYLFIPYFPFFRV